MGDADWEDGRKEGDITWDFPSDPGNAFWGMEGSITSLSGLASIHGAGLYITGFDLWLTDGFGRGFMWPAVWISVRSNA